MPAAINLPENTVRCLTPAGPGAVAVLQLELPTADHAANVLAKFEVSTATSLRAPVHLAPINRILFGQWRGEDVLLVRTATTRWELHCHGGPAAVRRILADLTAVGVRENRSGAPSADPEGSTGVAGNMASVTDQIAAAVQRTLALCRTRQAADWILRQLDGRLVDPVTQLQTGSSASRHAARVRLLHNASFTDLLLRPARVGLFGPPNAGKSSLLNALCGLSRAIVSPVAGTTRDPVEAETQVGGRILCLTDTAGLHDQPDSMLEADGIRRTRELVADCDAACILAPADQPLPDLTQLAAPFMHCPTRILVRSRCDLNPSSPPGSGNAYFCREVSVSAVSGEGIEDLRQTLFAAIFPAEPAPETPLPLPGLLDDPGTGG
ncbi:MAG: GTPase [Planctomycetaceae bacterium]